MKALFEKFEDDSVQEYIYDCLKACHDRILSMGVMEPEAGVSNFPWRIGEKQVNIVGVRGFVEGESRIRNLQNQWDDLIFVARLVDGKKCVSKFVASLDYSDGSAPILLEGCYRYWLGYHKISGHFSYPQGSNAQPLAWNNSDANSESKSGPGYKLKNGIVSPLPPAEPFPPILKPNPYPVVGKEGPELNNYRVFNSNELLTWNVANRTRKLINGYSTGIAYRAMVGGETFLARDANQNLVYDPGELLDSDDYGINIHFGGSGADVGLNGAGCQVIKGWAEFIAFMSIIERDASIKGSIRNELPGGPAIEVDGTEFAIYTLVQGSVFCHFLQTQVSSPLGEPRNSGFGKIHPFEYLSLGEWRNSDLSEGVFPVSGSLKIHSGMHIYAQADSGTSTTRAVAPFLAKVVAAQLHSEVDADFGSTNFILLEFNAGRSSCKAFALLMHLGNADLSDAAIESVPWMKRTAHSSDGRGGERISKLRDGEVVAFNELVIPGEILGEPGSIGAKRGIHFEVFSEENLYWKEEMPIQEVPKRLERVTLKDFPNYKPFIIAKVDPGDSYCLVGEKTIFQVSEVANYVKISDRLTISWKVRIISEDGTVLLEEDFLNAGPILEYNVPSVSTSGGVNISQRIMTPEIVWCEVVAQPYLERPDCRWVISRRILPSRITSLSSEAIQLAANPKKLKEIVLEAFGDLMSESDKLSFENARSIEESRERFTSLILRGESQQLRNRWDSLVLNCPSEWNFIGEEARKQAESNGYRWHEELVAPYAWWSKVKAAGVSLPDQEALFFFHPILFLRSIVLVAESLIWISNVPLKSNEIDYVGGARVKDASNGPKETGRQLRKGTGLPTGATPKGEKGEKPKTEPGVVFPRATVG